MVNDAESAGGGADHSVEHLLHQGLRDRRAFSARFRRGRFGPSSRGLGSFTPALPGEGQLLLDFRPLIAHEIPLGTRPCLPFGPSSWRSRPCDPRLFLPFRVSVSIERTDSPRLLCRLLTSACWSERLAAFPVPVRNHRQISRGKFDRLPRTTAGSTLCVLDGWGLRCHWPARPTLAPSIRLLFVGSRVCSTLPSDPASRRRPCASLILRLHQAG